MLSIITESLKGFVSRDVRFRQANLEMQFAPIVQLYNMSFRKSSSDYELYAPDCSSKESLQIQAPYALPGVAISASNNQQAAQHSIVDLQRSEAGDQALQRLLASQWDHPEQNEDGFRENWGIDDQFEQIQGLPSRPIQAASQQSQQPTTSQISITSIPNQPTANGGASAYLSQQYSLTRNDPGSLTASSLVPLPEPPAPLSPAPPSLFQQMLDFKMTKPNNLEDARTNWHRDHVAYATDILQDRPQLLESLVAVKRQIAEAQREMRMDKKQLSVAQRQKIRRKTKAQNSYYNKIEFLKVFMGIDPINFPTIYAEVGARLKVLCEQQEWENWQNNCSLYHFLTLGLPAIMKASRLTIEERKTDANLKGCW